MARRTRRAARRGGARSECAKCLSSPLSCRQRQRTSTRKVNLFELRHKSERGLVRDLSAWGGDECTRFCGVRREVGRTARARRKGGNPHACTCSLCVMARRMCGHCANLCEVNAASDVFLFGVERISLDHMAKGENKCSRCQRWESQCNGLRCFFILTLGAVTARTLDTTRSTRRTTHTTERKE